MPIYNIHAAKTHFSRLVVEMEKGEEVIIARAGKPVGKIVPIKEEKPSAIRRFGFMEGKFKLPDNFEEIDHELDKKIEKMFLGEDSE